MVVLDMGFEMASQVGDPLGEDGHLNLRRTRIAGLQCIVFDERGLALDGDRHRYVLNVAASRTRLLGAAEPGCRPGRSKRPGGTRTGGLYRIRRAAPEGLWPRVPSPAHPGDGWGEGARRFPKLERAVIRRHCPSKTGVSR